MLIRDLFCTNIALYRYILHTFVTLFHLLQFFLQLHLIQLLDEVVNLSLIVSLSLFVNLGGKIKAS
jgi:hypothetical protein